MTGYQEMLTDPSFAGQIVVPTYPLIGNYGINERDFESARVQVAGFVVREHSTTPSHSLSTTTLDAFLADQGVTGVSGVDTRAVTRRLRDRGVMMGVIAVDESPDEALARLRRLPGYDGVDFVEQVTTPQALRVGAASARSIDMPGRASRRLHRKENTGRRLRSQVQHPARAAREGMRGGGDAGEGHRRRDHGA